MCFRAAALWKDGMVPDNLYDLPPLESLVAVIAALAFGFCGSDTCVSDSTADAYHEDNLDTGSGLPCHSEHYPVFMDGTLDMDSAPLALVTRHDSPPLDGLKFCRDTDCCARSPTSSSCLTIPPAPSTTLSWS